MTDWMAIGFRIYEIDDLGNPGRFLADAQDHEVAAQMADTHNSMLAALRFVTTDPCFSELGSVTHDEVREAIANAEGTKP